MPPYKEYGPGTGVYQQWDIPVPKIMLSSWNRVNYFGITESTLPNRSDALRVRGPAPLVDICLRVSLQHINEIDKAHLQYLPTRLVGRIWKELKCVGGLSAETWKLMATRLAGDEEATQYISPLMMRYLTTFKKMQPLTAYIEPLVSSTFDFLAHLTISGNIKGNNTELLQLVQLKNLAVLEFLQPNEGDMTVSPLLTDSVLREWSRIPDPFPVLRVLRVWANNCTTRHSLRYINAFPSLILYDVAGKRRDWAEKSEDPDWKSERKVWAKELDHTIIKQFHLLEDDIPDHRWKLKPEALENITFDLSHAFQKPETELAIFPRDNYEAYNDIYKVTKGTKSTKVCRPPYYWFPETMVNESLWGFLMYCHIGRLISDRDILAQGLEIRETAFVLKNIILPPRPMIHLVLADDYYNREGPTVFLGNPEDGSSALSSSRARREFQIQLTFIRKDYHLAKKRTSGLTKTGSESVKRALDVPSSTQRPLKKRRDISNILKSFDK